MDTGLIYIIGFLAIVVGIPVYLLSGRKIWTCPRCDFTTYDEQEALGHQTYHTHKMTQ